jgi:hypothetical protein
VAEGITKVFFDFDISISSFAHFRKCCGKNRGEFMYGRWGRASSIFKHLKHIFLCTFRAGELRHPGRGEHCHPSSLFSARHGPGYGDSPKGPPIFWKQPLFCKNLFACDQPRV